MEAVEGWGVVIEDEIIRGEWEESSGERILGYNWWI